MPELDSPYKLTGFARRIEFSYLTRNASVRQVVLIDQERARLAGDRRADQDPTIADRKAAFAIRRYSQATFTT
jgi:hypothetical protein